MRARVLGAGISEAGDCSVQWVDLSTPLPDGKATAENRTLVTRGPDCVVADGARGSGGFYATIAAAFATIALIFAPLAL